MQSENGQENWKCSSCSKTCVSGRCQTPFRASDYHERHPERKKGISKQRRPLTPEVEASVGRGRGLPWEPMGCVVLLGPRWGSSWRQAVVLLLQASYYLKKKKQLGWWGRTVSGSCVSPIFKLVFLHTSIFFTDITIMNWIFSGLSQEDRLWENYDSDQICLYLSLLLCYSYNHQIENIIDINGR